MSSNQFQDLIEKFISEKSTPEEVAALRRMLQEEKYAIDLDALMDNQLAASTAIAEDYPEVVSRLKKIIEQKIGEESKPAVVRRMPAYRRWVAAAAILIIIAIGGFIWMSNQSSEQNNTGKTLTKIDVDPGKQGAILTLSNGATIILDSLGNGVIATENGSQVRLDNGQLVYGKDGAAPVYNTVSTPKGRQFRLTLQDGTKIWLNAASSIRYPTLFTGNQRNIEVTGEVYLEVAQNTKAPFHVKVNNKTEIQVLGTHFNINSYNNEASINTTLLEGSVKVINGSEKVVIKPGQQAQIENNTQANIKILSDVDVEKITAWKNGKFNFRDATLKEVMRELERWYDIEVVYEKGVQEQEFYGTMDRGLLLSEVLHGLNLSEVKFRIEQGRKLVLMP